MGNKFESLKEVNNFSEISNQYNALICDIWGVIHNGQELFPGINECLLNFKMLNNVVILLSNAPRPSSYVSSVLDKLGFKDECYDGIITSGDLTKKSLDEKIFGENCYHIGPERDLNIFEGTNVNRVDFNNSDFIFVTGLFNDEIEDENDYLDLLNSAREREMTLVCANPDLLVQRGDKLIPCAGLISKTYEEMGGKVVNIGKPFSPIFKEAIEMVKKNSKFDEHKILVVGDGLETDIKGANSIGLDSILVLGGLFSNNSKDKILESIENKGIYPNFFINEFSW
jgi:HAD superfamily hydrolase (TIGR01459 family)